MTIGRQNKIATTSRRPPRLCRATVIRTMVKRALELEYAPKRHGMRFDRTGFRPAIY